MYRKKEMKTPVRLESVFPIDLVTEMRERADAVLGEIYEDYFSAKSFDDFRLQHTGHHSLTMKIASYRFITGDLFSKLRDCLLNRLAEVYGDHEISEILLHPIFYLRFSWPDIIYSDEENRAFLGSQPHYDCSYGVVAYSFWMPLEDTVHETGGLCYFQDDAIFDYFPPTMTRNHLNFDRYVAAAPQN